MAFLQLDGFRSPDRALNRPTRFVISDIFKSTGSSSGCCLAGRVESGMIQIGDKLLLLPLNEVAHVKSKISFVLIISSSLDTGKLLLP